MTEFVKFVSFKIEKCAYSNIIRKLFVIMFFCMMPVILTSATDDLASRHVLIINSYHRGYQWTDEQSDSAFKYVTEIVPSATIDVVYMDWKRFPFPTTVTDFYTLLGNKYRNKKIDLIMTTDDAALAFAVKYRKEILHNAPVVFMGIFESSDSLLTGNQPGITGVYESVDLEGTIAAAHSILKKSGEIYIIHDKSETSLTMESDINRILDRMHSPLKRNVLGGLVFSELLDSLSRINPDSVVILASYARDPNNLILPPEIFAEKISGICCTPVFVMYTHMMGTGALGGILLDGKLQGRKAAELAGRILTDKKEASEIPRVSAKTVIPFFDYNVMKKFNIKEGSLPDGSYIMNRPESFYYRYKYYIWLNGFILLLLLAFSISLSINRILRRKYENEILKTAALVSSGDDMICAADEEYAVEYMNPSATKFYGGSAPDSGKRMFVQDLFVMKGKDLLHRILAELSEKGLWKGELSAADSEGREIPVSAVFVAYQASSAKKKYVSIIIRDISQQKAVEEKLKITLDSINDAVLSVDSSGRILSMNPSAENIFGITFENSYGLAISEVIEVMDELSNSSEENPVMTVLKNASSVIPAGKRFYVARNGEKIILSVSAAPVRNRSGEIEGAVMVCRDISDETRLHEELRQSQRMEVLGQLAGGVAHDFNNLLSAIMGSAELIEKIAGSDPEIKSSAGDIITASSRAAELTKYLLSFSRKARMEIRSLDVHSVLDEVIRLLSRSIDKRIEIRKSFGAVNVTVKGDFSLLQSSFLNLAVNARDAVRGNGLIEFTTSNTVLDMTYSENGKWEISPGEFIRIAVHDSGEGMSESVKKHIFEPYFTTKPAGKGTGLGLAAVYGCVKSHSGIIRLESSEGKGSVFEIFLPIEKSESAESVSGETNAVKNGHGRIMIVDDEEIVRNVASGIVRSLGYDIFSFSDGEEAVYYYRDNWQNIDLVILDLIMPKMSGREVFKMLKEINPSARILISSGYDRNSEADKLIEEGASGFIAKPFRLAGLSVKIHSILSENGI